MSGINFTKFSLLVVSASVAFLLAEYHYKKSHYYDEKLYDLQLHYEDKYRTFLTLTPSKSASDPSSLQTRLQLCEPILRSMEENLDADYTLVFRADRLKDEPNTARFDLFPYNKGYLTPKSLLGSAIFADTADGRMRYAIEKRMESGDSFALHRVDSLFESSVFLFSSLRDPQNIHQGYIVSKRIEGTINLIIIEQLLKFLSVVGALGVLWIFYRRHLRSALLLDQYKTFVDKTTLLSKTDTHGRITYVNEAFESLSGYRADELIGKPHSIVRHPDMPAEAFKELWETIQNGSMWQGKIKNRKKEGSSYTVAAAVFPIKNEQGKIIEYIAIRHDITELEALKELLEKDLLDSSQSLKEKMSLLAQYERAIEHSASYTRTDPKGVITYLNKTCEHLTGYTREELIGKTHKPLRDPSTPSSFYRELWESIQHKKIWKGIIKNRTKEGDCLFLDTLIVPIVDHNDAIVEYMGIQYDVTELLLLQQDIVDTQREVIYKMGEIGETRSKETGNHVKRVAEYSRLLALKAGLDAEEAALIHSASPMHDIGKVGIPDSILNKEGGLDDREWEVMRSHCDIGHKILKKSDRPILKTAAIIAYQHHERYDGTGYPQRLSGEAIHIYGRITAIADVFDALGSDRVYKKAWEIDAIIDYFKHESGKQFDPVLTDIFIQNIPEFLRIRDQFVD
jgi:PAS domain S-box-containing protein